MTKYMDDDEIRMHIQHPGQGAPGGQEMAEDPATGRAAVYDPVMGADGRLPAEGGAKQLEPQQEDPAREERIRRLMEQIDLDDAYTAISYGSGAQKRMAEFSQAALENVRTKDLGQVGDLLTGVVKELKDFEPEEKKGFFSLFKKNTGRLAAMKARYDQVETTVSGICKNLEAHQVRLMKDVALLDKMYEENLAYYRDLTETVEAGRRRLAMERQEHLPYLADRAAASGLPEDAQAAKDLEEKCIRFEKKLHDLELTRTISMQTAPQIRLVQNNNTLMIEKIQSTIVNTIPLWKSQMVLALGIEHSAQAARAQKEVSDLTNTLLKQNAQKLKTASVETAKESERGIVDLETLRQTNEALIATFDEVMQIQREGRQKRLEAQAELTRIEEELKQKLLEAAAPDRGQAQA